MVVLSLSPFLYCFLFCNRQRIDQFIQRFGSILHGSVTFYYVISHIVYVHFLVMFDELKSSQFCFSHITTLRIHASFRFGFCLVLCVRKNVKNAILFETMNCCVSLLFALTSHAPTLVIAEIQWIFHYKIELHIFIFRECRVFDLKCVTAAVVSTILMCKLLQLLLAQNRISCNSKSEKTHSINWFISYGSCDIAVACANSANATQCACDSLSLIKCCYKWVVSILVWCQRECETQMNSSNLFGRIYSLKCIHHSQSQYRFQLECAVD